MSERFGRENRVGAQAWHFIDIEGSSHTVPSSGTITMNAEYLAQKPS